MTNIHNYTMKPDGCQCWHLLLPVKSAVNISFMIKSVKAQMTPLQRCWVGSLSLSHKVFMYHARGRAPKNKERERAKVRRWRYFLGTVWKERFSGVEGDGLYSEQNSMRRVPVGRCCWKRQLTSVWMLRTSDFYSTYQFNIILSEGWMGSV